MTGVNDIDLQWVAGLILGLHPPNERRRYFVTSHWLDANLESAVSGTAVQMSWRQFIKVFGS